jgi:formyltetrahydrofolate deformylase
MIILIQCTDRIGLVAAISGVLAYEGLNITSLREHVDQAENRFFLRLETALHTDIPKLSTALQNVLPADASITIGAGSKKQIAIMVTKEYHCLADILIKNFFNTLDASVLAVIGNHPTLKDVCDRFSIPFYLVSHEQKSKQEFEVELITLLDNLNADYIILAKFMRILSPELIARFPKKIINIHHSFLPAFIGASPYRQAFERGVKLIGATAHFVTDDLDQGPIITQATIPVSHSLTAGDMITAGKEIETSVLGRAMSLVFNERVFVHKNKTIVFDF